MAETPNVRHRVSGEQAVKGFGIRHFVAERPIKAHRSNGAPSFENSPLRMPVAKIGWNSAPNSTLISCGLYDSRSEDNLLKTRCDSVGGRQGKNTAVPSPHLMMRSTLRMRGWTIVPAASMGTSGLITP